MERSIFEITKIMQKTTVHLGDKNVIACAKTNSANVRDVSSSFFERGLDNVQGGAGRMHSSGDNIVMLSPSFSPYVTQAVKQDDGFTREHVEQGTLCLLLHAILVTSTHSRKTYVGDVIENYRALVECAALINPDVDTATLAAVGDEVRNVERMYGENLCRALQCGVFSQFTLKDAGDIHDWPMDILKFGASAEMTSERCAVLSENVTILGNHACVIPAGTEIIVPHCSVPTMCQFVEAQAEASLFTGDVRIIVDPATHEARLLLPQKFEDLADTAARARKYMECAHPILTSLLTPPDICKRRTAACKVRASKRFDKEFIGVLNSYAERCAPSVVSIPAVSLVSEFESSLQRQLYIQQAMAALSDIRCDKSYHRDQCTATMKLHQMAPREFLQLLSDYEAHVSKVTVYKRNIYKKR